MVNIAPLNVSALKKSSEVSEKKCYGAVLQKELFNFFILVKSLTLIVSVE